MRGDNPNHTRIPVWEGKYLDFNPHHTVNGFRHPASNKDYKYGHKRLAAIEAEDAAGLTAWLLDARASEAAVAARVEAVLKEWLRLAAQANHEADLPVVRDVLMAFDLLESIPKVLAHRDKLARISVEKRIQKQAMAASVEAMDEREVCELFKQELEASGQPGPSGVNQMTDDEQAIFDAIVPDSDED